MRSNPFVTAKSLDLWSDKYFRWVFIGRTLDITRCLRLFHIYRNVIKRTGDIAPTLICTLMLVFSAVHIYTYIGMTLFGNKIAPGHTKDIEPFYDLNNFNSYSKVSTANFITYVFFFRTVNAYFVTCRVW